MIPKATAGSTNGFHRALNPARGKLMFVSVCPCSGRNVWHGCELRTYPKKIMNSFSQVYCFSEWPTRCVGWVVLTVWDVLSCIGCVSYWQYELLTRWFVLTVCLVQGNCSKPQAFNSAANETHGIADNACRIEASSGGLTALFNNGSNARLWMSNLEFRMKKRDKSVLRTTDTELYFVDNGIEGLVGGPIDDNNSDITMLGAHSSCIQPSIDELTRLLTPWSYLYEWTTKYSVNEYKKTEIIHLKQAYFLKKIVFDSYFSFKTYEATPDRFNV